MSLFPDTESPIKNKFQNQTRLLAYISLLGFLSVSIQSVSGLSLKVTVISTAYMIATSFSGAIIWSSLKSQTSSIEELTGMGMALGSIFVALINILYRKFSYGMPIATLILCIFSSALYSIFNNKKTRHDANQFKVSIGSAQYIAACVLGYISVISNYVFPYFIASIIGIFLFRLTKSYQNVQILIYIAFMSIGWCITNLNKSLNDQNFPSWRWIGNDAIYDTSYSVGIGRFGIRDNILYSNNSSKGYLLTYSWAGEFANVTHINQLSISTVSFAVFGLLGIGFAALTIGSFLLNSATAAKLSVALIFCQAIFPEPFLLGEYLKLNNTISILWLLCLVYIVLCVKEREISSPVTILCILIPAITYGKIHFGIVAILFSTYLINLSSIYTELLQLKIAKFFKQIVLVGLPSLVSIVVFYKFINFPNRWPYSFSFDPWIISNAVLLFTFRFVGLRSGQSFTNKKFVATSNFIVLLTISYYLYSMGANNSIYIVSGAVIVSTFSLASIIDTALKKLNSTENIYIIGICSISFLAAFLISRDHAMNLWNYLKPGASTLKRSLYVEHQNLIMPLTFSFIFFCLLLLSSLKNFRNLFTKIKLVALIILVIISMNFGLFISIPLKSIILNNRYDAGIEQVFPIDAETIEAGEFIRDNTSRFTIVASNRICNLEIPNSMETPGWPPGSMPECGSLNFLTSISAVSERRQYLEAPAFENTIGPYLSSVSARRYKILLDVFNNPNSLSIDLLKQSGVTILLLDRDLDYSTNVFNFGKIIFQNQKITVISI